MQANYDTIFTIKAVIFYYLFVRFLKKKRGKKKVWYTRFFSKIPLASFPFFAMQQDFYGR